MKKALLFAILASAVLAACSDSDNYRTPGNRGEKGSLTINQQINLEVDGMNINSRAVGVEDLTVILNGPEGEKKIGFPAGGVVENLAVGSYTIKLTSHPDGYTPAFDNPVYEASTTAEVKKGITTPISITCTQVNAGVMFEYDPSLETVGYENIVPKVTRNDVSMEYSGENRTKAAYFAPGDVNITFTVDGEPVAIVGGETGKTVTLGAKELWKIKLTVTDSRYGAEGAAGPRLVLTVGGLDW